MSRSADAGDGRSFQNMTTPAPAGFPTVASELIARIWRGQTLAAMADEYTKYLYEEGICAIAKIPGNRGVQMLRTIDNGVADFQVLSYWDSVEAIKLFAGEDYEKVRSLPDDPKFMIGAAPTVRHFEVVVNHWPQR
jgi:heme-degrading monooxygenase HmoA